MNTTNRTRVSAASLAVVALFVGAALVTLSPATAAPIAIDLNTWSQKGADANGDWTPDGTGLSVTQNVEGGPTYFVSADDYRDVYFTGTVTVNSADDDFVGFLVDYTLPSGNGNKIGSYIIDWKGATQTASGYTAEEGFTLYRIDGEVPATDADYFACFWGKDDATCPATVTVIETNYGAGLGWQNGVTYDFLLRVGKNPVGDELIRLFIDGTPVIDQSILPNVNQVGLYTYQQDGVTFANLELNDNTAPEVEITTACADPGNGDWCLEPATYTASATEFGTGLDSVTCSVTGGGTDCSGATTAEGANTITIIATDGAGNTASRSAKVWVDTVRPTINVARLCGINGADNWCGSSVRVTATASDLASGVGTLTCTLNGDPSSCGPRWITGEGIHRFRITAIDMAGNEVRKTEIVKIDKSDPEPAAKTSCFPFIINGWCQSAVTVSGTASDDLSGVQAVECLINGAPLDCTNYDVATDGYHTYTVIATDNVGRVNSTSVDFKLDDTDPEATLHGPESGCSYVNDEAAVCTGLTTATGILTFNATASDALSGLDVVEFWVDGWLTATQTGSGPFIFQLNTADYANGDHVVQVRAKDVAGNFQKIDFEFTAINL